MFALPYIFGVFGRDTQRAKLVQLLKRFERPVSLAFSVEGCPSLIQHTSSYLDHKEYKRELLFTQNGVHVFKTEPMITVAADVMQKFKWLAASKGETFDEDKLHFILKATSTDNVSEHDVQKLLKPSVTLGDIAVDVLAWTLSQSTVTLLATSNIEEYCTIGSVLMSKGLELPHSLQVQQIYSVKYCTSKFKTGRPPNVLIYTGNNEQSSNNFKKLKSILGQCLDQDKYVIYQLKHSHVMTQPWQDNSTLLVLATGEEDLARPLQDTINEYVQNGGKLVSFCSQYALGITIKSSGMDKKLQDINVDQNLIQSVKSLGLQCVIDSVFEVHVKNKRGVKILASSAATSQAVIVSVLHGTGLAVMSLVNLFVDRLEEDMEVDCQRNSLLKGLFNYVGLACSNIRKSVLTKAYLLGHDQVKQTFLDQIEEVLVNNTYHGNNINILFSHDDEGCAEKVHPSQSFLPVITFAVPEKVSFSFQSYKEHLETNDLGQLVIYSEVVTSTQTILNGCLKLIKKLPKRCQPVIVGRQQTIGKGRGGNEWLSPDGCLSFSFPVQVDLNSNLGVRLPFLQHIAALAVVESVRSLKNYEGLDLRIKWPNDIYFGKDTKIGGILVNSSIQGKTFDAVVGIGVNLDNSEPTTCINDVLERENQLHGKYLIKLSREQLLARILNTMEYLLEDFQHGGPENFLIQYHQRWLHSDTQVMLESQNDEVVTVKGLDDSGFLSVVTSSNDIISLQPDSNSFDMMRNLIAIKTQR